MSASRSEQPHSQADIIASLAGNLVLAMTLANAEEQKRLAVEEENAALQYRVEHDDLTGLYNRSAFFDYTNRRLLEAKPDEAFGGLFVDLDNFKAINDLHPNGHDEGDDVLKTLAEILVACTRQDERPGAPKDLVARGNREDTGTARLGGDEFAASAKLYARREDGKAMKPEQRLEAWRARIADEFKKFLDGRPDLTALGVSVSISAVLHTPGETAEEMISRGDKALKAIKKAHHTEHGSYRPTISHS